MMMMNAHILGCFILISSVKYLTCSNPPFELEDNTLTAKEGSCIEITCRVTKSVSPFNAYWFWMKDPQWTDHLKDYSATIVYSTNNVTRPVSPEFSGRVHYVGSPSSSWSSSNLPSPRPQCSILICNLNKNDSGQYRFRFISGSTKWASVKNTTLTVTDNPCPITFEKQPVVKENDTITLTCSTLSSCSSSPQITDLSNRHQVQFHRNKTHNSTWVSFTASWQDDGRMFTCQAQNNSDKYLMRNISLSVEYAPKGISTTKSQSKIKEGDSVTLTCSAKGNPPPTFTWFRKNVTKGLDTTESSDEWKITSITDKHSGQYYCQAENKYGKLESDPMNINVYFAPEVEIKMSSPATVTEGDTVTLRCDVKRSNPQPSYYVWFKDGTRIDRESESEYVWKANPQSRVSYKCEASNSEGTGTSSEVLIKVHYRPRNTKIESKETVSVKGSLTLTCSTDAYPAPHTYSWYRDNQQTDSQRRTFANNKILILTDVQRADEGCYTCYSTNSIGSGTDSDEKCIKVLYPPTVPVLSMAPVVTETQTVTISCSAESNPAPTLSLTMSTLNTPEPRLSKPRSDSYGQFNQLNYTFKVTSGDAGVYTCKASNTEGSNQSQKKLVVRYAPKDVKITGQDVVNENKSLTLSCTASSFPSSSFSWTKDGKEGLSPSWKSQKLIVESVSPSDSGAYRCTASNDMGATQSQAAEVKVKYAPKHTDITQSKAQQHSDGRSYITLTCSTQCYPPATQYMWYREEKGKRPQLVHDGQTHRVFSDQPGTYYCVARNVIKERRSDAVHLFDSTFTKVLNLFLCLFLILLIAVIFVLVYRHRKNNSAQPGAARHCCSFLGWFSRPSRGPEAHGTFLVEPSRSRDDLLSDRSPRHPAPDSTPASDVHTVYSVVNLPPQKQAASAQKASGLQGGQTEAHGPTYASLHFGKKTNNKQQQPTQDDVYAKVCRSNPHKKNENEWLTDYENLGATVAAKAPEPSDDDTSSGDDDVQLNYAQVNFTAKPGRQRGGRDSSSSDDYDVQYSDIKI